MISFGCSVVFGIILCLVYDVFRALRKTVSHTITLTFFEDLLFSFLAAVTTFLFLLSTTNGEIRGYVLLGAVFGFILSRLTISRIFCFLLKLVFSRLNLIFCYVNKIFYSGFDVMEKKILEICKKSGKTVKKLLKIPRDLLYTKGNRKV